MKAQHPVANRCFLCNGDGSAAPAYMRILNQKAGIGSITARWLNVGFPVCDNCFTRGRSITWLGLLPIAEIIIPIVLVLITSPFFRGTPAADPILAAASISILAGFPVTMIVTHILIGRRTEQVLGPAVDRLLRSMSGIKKWGLMKRVVFLRKIPDGETYMSLRDVG
jgi:hypothetical protein